MTLSIAHKIEQALRFQDKRVRPERELPLEECAAMAEQLRVAEKFFFTNIPMERHDEETADLPKLTKEEWDFWHAGLLPLPADDCWFECDIGDGPGLHRAGWFVCAAEAGGMDFRRVDYHPAEGVVCTPPMWGSMKYGSDHVLVFGKRGAVEALGHSREWAEKLSVSLAGEACLLVYLLLMLHSRTTERRAEDAPVKLNKHRVAAGKPPLYSHTVVDIVPKRWVQAAHAATEGGSKRSPRLHWRRSHLRRFQHQTPNSQWVPALQCWAVAIPRFLVGKAELGEVTHEYRVRA